MKSDNALALTAPETAKGHNGLWNFSMVLFVLYILFNYIAQETLLPTVLHSLITYAFIAWSAVCILIKGKIQLTSYTLWYSAMFIFSAMSMLWAKELGTGSLYTMFVALVLTFCVINTVDSLERLELSMLTFVVAANVMGILILATNQFSFGEGERFGEQITGNANIFSALLMISSVFAAWFFIYKKGIKRYICLGSFVFQLLLMGLSGGRKTVIVTVACLLWFFLTYKITKIERVIGNIIKASVVFLIIYWVIMNVPILYESIGVRFEELIKMLQGGESAVSSDMKREKMVEIGLEAWKRRPLFGYGLDTFKYYNRQMTGSFYYAHNNYVELLYDLGLLGTVLYYGYFICLFWKLKNLPYAFEQFRNLGIGILLGLLIFDFGGVSYYTVFIQIVLCLVYAIVQSVSNARTECVESEIGYSNNNNIQAAGGDGGTGIEKCVESNISCTRNHTCR